MNPDEYALTQDEARERLAKINAAIKNAATKCQRDPDSICLVAVSKYRTLESIFALLDSGQHDFGESYGQEIRDKMAASKGRSKPPRWHFMGPLQKNKIKYLLGGIHLIHSIDAKFQIEEFDRRRDAISAKNAKTAPRQNCLLQINIAKEPQKRGIPAEALPQFLEYIANSRHLACRGLMLIPPKTNKSEESRSYFSALRDLRDENAQRGLPHVQLEELSMGMSDDFETAIEEGATIIRIGTAIFGPRPPR